MLIVKSKQKVMESGQCIISRGERLDAAWLTSLIKKENKNSFEFIL